MSCSGYIYGASQVAAGEKAVVGFSIADALQTGANDVLGSFNHPLTTLPDSGLSPSLVNLLSPEL